MKTLYTNTTIYEVRHNEDGTLFITKDGKTSIPNAGAFINNMGGIDGVLARTTESEYNTLQELHQHIRMERAAQQRIREERDAAKNKEFTERITAQYEALKANGTIETTPDNLYIVLAYLNTQNWGVWALPRMTIGYKANQYQDGNATATAIVLDEPIEYDGCLERCFCVGATPRSLPKYVHLR